MTKKMYHLMFNLYLQLPVKEMISYVIEEIRKRNN